MKAILVIDMPKSCAVCPIFQESIDGYCPVGFLSPSNKYEIPKGCPLKPLPQYRYTVEDTGLSPTDQILIQSGWNDCLDEITGETDESNIGD